MFVVKPVAWKALDICGKCKIVLFAKTQDGESVKIIFSGYTPNFFVDRGEEGDMDMDDLRNLQQALSKGSANVYSSSPCPKPVRHSSKACKLSLRQLPSFHTSYKKNTIIQVDFESIAHYKAACSRVRYLRGGYYKAREHKVPISIKFLVQNGLTYTDCIGIAYENLTSFECLLTEHSYYAHPRNIVKEVEQFDIMPTIMGFDIEQATADEDFFPCVGDREAVAYQIGVHVATFDYNAQRYEHTRCGFNVGACYAKDVIVSDTEKENFERFFEYIRIVDPDVIIGHNTDRYDWQVIFGRYRTFMRWGPVPNFSRIDVEALERNDPDHIGEQAFYKMNWESSAFTGGFRIFRPVCHGRLIFDLYVEVKMDKSLKILNCKLDTVLKHYLGYGKSPVSPADIFRAWREKCPTQIGTVMDYCFVDAKGPVEVYIKRNCWNNHMSLAKVCTVHPEWVQIRGQGIKGLCQIYREVYNVNMYIGKWDCDEVYKIKGGKVVAPKSGRHEWVLVPDFASLYPSIMIAYNLCYSTVRPKEWVDANPDVDVRKITLETQDGVRKDVYFLVNQEGVVPALVKSLLARRARIRKGMKSVDKSSQQYAVMNGSQLAVKVAANSIYGITNSKYSLGMDIFQPDVGGAVTSMGRELITQAKDYLEENYGTEEVYGDSVTADTPVLVRIRGEVCTMRISELYDTFAEENVDSDEKMYVNPDSVESYTDSGWTKVQTVMKHKTNKKIYGVLAHTGYVEVTEDHGLLDSDGIEVSPKDLNVGDYLLTCEGCESDVVKKITLLRENSEEYVYDLTTGNHHFQAGIGNIVVHNTDSTMVKLPIKDPSTWESLANTMIEDINTNVFTPPISMDPDYMLRAVVFLRKKKYFAYVVPPDHKSIGLTCEEDLLTYESRKIMYKGVKAARSEDCAYYLDLYKDVCRLVLNGQNEQQVTQRIRKSFEELACGRVSIKHLLMSVQITVSASETSWGYKLKSYMIDNGYDVSGGDKVQYFIADIPVEGDKLGERLRPLAEVDQYDVHTYYYIKKKFIPALDKIIGATYYGDPDKKTLNVKKWLLQWKELIALRKMYGW